jgi:hypothetical protein
MAKRKSTKEQTTIYKKQNRTLRAGNQVTLLFEPKLQMNDQ